MTVQSLLVRLEPDQLRELAKLVAAELSDATRPETYTTKEAAKLLRVSEKTIHRRVAAGLIPTVPNMGKVLIPADALDQDCGRNMEDPDRRTLLRHPWCYLF